MCCTEAIVRILVFVANIGCLLIGGVLIGLGTYHLINIDSDYFQGIPEEYQVVRYLPTIAIVLGAIVLVIAFLGCCGTLRSNTCMLSTYAIILIIIFVLQVALGIYGLVTINDTDEFQSQINTTVSNLFKQYNVQTDVTGIVNLIQKNLDCCGPDSSSFWISINEKIPDSCYSDDGALFEKGCSQALYDLIMSSVTIIAIVALVVSLIEILGAVFALYLNNRIKSKKAYA
ncbi:23 kDa integral membrane protein-like [Anthonomus grandis grandis]|uniref:23 kDa integral membrane protein-like n=1 Tax=Anthonomus grandis grandis TaxID=2921223 RepID=UPI0021652231|nr:23 kDa integral membrane protein-like [Anthonomus grandis grandis]